MPSIEWLVVTDYQRKWYQTMEQILWGKRELSDLVRALDETKIQQSTANKGIKWYFNPPLAPHFGGVHESMIKAAKRTISAVLGNAGVTDDN